MKPKWILTLLLLNSSLDLLLMYGGGLKTHHLWMTFISLSLAVIGSFLEDKRENNN